LHDPAAVDLKRYLADSGFCRSLLVEQATGNQWQNFAFTGREVGKTLLEPGQLRPPQAGCAILTDCL
jgi:hypothetical protein